MSGLKWGSLNGSLYIDGAVEDIDCTYLGTHKEYQYSYRLINNSSESITIGTNARGEDIHTAPQCVTGWTEWLDIRPHHIARHLKNKNRWDVSISESKKREK